MTDRGLTHIALPVTDMEKSLDFYRRYASMQVVHRRTNEAGTGDVVWISDRTRPFVIVLLTDDSVEHPLLPFAHMGVACETREEIDRLSKLAESENILLKGPTDSGEPVGYWCFIRDPDGHTLELSFGQNTAIAVGKSPQNGG